jgi:dienelactone hydrolase
MRRQGVVALLASLILTACSSVDLNERRAAAARLATDAGWQMLNLDAKAFVLAAFVPPDLRQADTLSIYMEGDGLAWIDAAMPSFDPTPVDPLALRLALRDAAAGTVYLARPCQYVAGAARRNCEAKYWTGHRFSPQVIEATNVAVDRLKERFGAQRLILVGYSGGGAVAALIAAERSDVVRLVTIAGNLEHRAWTSEQKLSPLSGSRNPADAWQGLTDIPQIHYVGGRDKVVGESVARAYAARFPPGKRPTIVVVPEFDHHCCWVDRWPASLDFRSAPARPGAEGF